MDRHKTSSLKPQVLSLFFLQNKELGFQQIFTFSSTNLAYNGLNHSGRDSPPIMSSTLSSVFSYALQNVNVHSNKKEITERLMKGIQLKGAGLPNEHKEIRACVTHQRGILGLESV